MRLRHLLPLSALVAWVGVAAPALADPVSATATFNFRVGTTAPTTSYWSAGRGDIDIHDPINDPGDWEIHYHFHSEPDLNNPSQPADPPSGGGTPAFPGTPELHDGEFEWKWGAADLTMFINSGLPAAQRVRALGNQWNFTGVAAGETFYVLPASEVAGLPFLGFSAQGKPFDITFSLGAVTSTSTGGHISGWILDGDGNMYPAWSSFDSASNVGFTVPAGAHEHMFIGFSQVGDYTVQITAVPEPGSLGLAGAAGLGLAAFAWNRRRRG